MIRGGPSMRECREHEHMSRREFLGRTSMAVVAGGAVGALSSGSKAMAEAAQASEKSEAPKPFVRAAAKVGRNDPCPCGSGKKFKKCCGAGQQ